MCLGCLDLSFGCLDVSFGCLDLSFGCFDLSLGCLDMNFWCLDQSFVCLDVSFGCLQASAACLDLCFGCPDVHRCVCWVFGLSFRLSGVWMCLLGAWICLFWYWTDNFQALITLAASAASRKTKSRGPRSRDAPCPGCPVRFVVRPSQLSPVPCRPGSPWISVPWIWSFWRLQ